MTYQCDNCKKTFEKEQIKFKFFPENLSFSDFPILVLTEENKIEYKIAEHTDKVCHCPYCDEPHLSGFDIG